MKKSRSVRISFQKLCYHFFPSAIFGSQHSVLHLCGPCSSLGKKIRIFWQVFETGEQQAACAGVTSLAHNLLSPGLLEHSQSRVCPLLSSHLASHSSGESRGAASSSTWPGTGSAGSWNTGNEGVFAQGSVPGGKNPQINLSSGIIGT